jgi:divalent metal cation (Fe/Co/Zn/Cd) transporter
MVYESKCLLVGEGVSRKTAQDLRTLIAGDPAVERVGKLATMYLGPEDVMLAVEIRFHSDNSLEDIRCAIARITQAIRERQPRVRHVFLDALSIAHDVRNAP